MGGHRGGKWFAEVKPPTECHGVTYCDCCEIGHRCPANSLRGHVAKEVTLGGAPAHDF